MIIVIDVIAVVVGLAGIGAKVVVGIGVVVELLGQKFDSVHIQSSAAVVDFVTCIETRWGVGRKIGIFRQYVHTGISQVSNRHGQRKHDN